MSVINPRCEGFQEIIALAHAAIENKAAAIAATVAVFAA